MIVKNEVGQVFMHGIALTEGENWHADEFFDNALPEVDGDPARALREE